jgi:ribonuclease P protein component
LTANEAMASFKKHERLTGARQIEKLFDRTGNTFKSYPLMFIVRNLEFDDQSKLKVVISVSKKRFSKAVDRNLIRRRIRAIHQLFKSDLTTNLEQRGSCGVGIVYLSNSIQEHKVIEDAYKNLLVQLNEINS